MIGDLGLLILCAYGVLTAIGSVAALRQSGDLGLSHIQAVVFGIIGDWRRHRRSRITRAGSRLDCRAGCLISGIADMEWADYGQHTPFSRDPVRRVSRSGNRTHLH